MCCVRVTNSVKYNRRAVYDQTTSMKKQRVSDWSMQLPLLLEIH